MNRSQRYVFAAFLAAQLCLLTVYAVAQQTPASGKPAAATAAPAKPPAASTPAASCPCPMCAQGECPMCNGGACGAKAGQGPQGGGCMMAGGGHAMHAHGAPGAHGPHGAKPGCPLHMAKDLGLDVKVEKTKTGAVLRIDAKDPAKVEEAQRVASMIAQRIGAEAGPLLPAGHPSPAK